MQEQRRSQQVDNVIDWQSPKVVLPRLKAKKAGSLPSYGNLKSGGDLPKSKLTDFTLSQDTQYDAFRLIDFPRISAKSWIIYHKESQTVLKTSNPRQRRQVASLTKMMTALCTLEICEKYNMIPKQTFFRVTATSTDVSGTLANLQPFEWMNVMDLLYGLMLPSGNDAANLLAENLGAVLYFEDKGEDEVLKEIKSIDLTDDEDNIGMYMDYFMEYMNLNAKKIGMRNTKFTNSHGLDFRNNYSCCEDLLKLTLECYKIDILRKIASTKQHRAQVRLYRNKIMYKKSITWSNTNKLLGVAGCHGLKTGYTPKAGGCLSSVFTTDFSDTTSTIVMIVLGCRTQDHRFIDTTHLVEWVKTEEIRGSLRS